MSKQCVIVGLGKYGKSVAKKLSDSGVDVLAIDNNIKVIESVSSYVAKAICLDVTDAEIWDKIPLKNFDIGVVGFGENITASILSCMALKEAGIDYIIAKAADKYHKKILEKLGISEIVIPEEYVADMTVQNIIEKDNMQLKKINK